MMLLIWKNIQIVFLKNNESLKEFGEARVERKNSESVFNDQVEREKKVVESELLTIKLMNQAAAQRAVNSAINVFINAVKVAL